MTRFLTITILLSGLVSSQIRAADEAVSLQYKFSPDVDLRYRLVESSDMVMDMGTVGNQKVPPIKMVATSSDQWLYRIISANDDGSADFGLVVEKLDGGLTVGSDHATFDMQDDG